MEGWKDGWTGMDTSGMQREGQDRQGWVTLGDDDDALLPRLFFFLPSSATPTDSTHTHGLPHGPAHPLIGISRAGWVIVI